MNQFNPVTNVILSLIKEWESKLASLNSGPTMQNRNSQNRTIKQILGHLIDSSSNNTHRIVHLQYQPSPLAFPNYATYGNNDRWIAIQDYQNEDWTTLTQLWKYSLLHLCHVINHIDDDFLENEWISGPDETITLKAMVNGFPKHLKLHLSEIEELMSRTS